MPTVSYDAQSLMIDGRRIWLTSGAIHYPRVPREMWRSRIRAAKQAGLNCIETYVFWNVHELRPGVFDFTTHPLREFVQLIGQQGMYCILRPGPYVCASWDFGGLPAWLLRGPGGQGASKAAQQEMMLRQANVPFMEATARYLGAVMNEVKDLQVTSTAPPGAQTQAIGGGGGPIVLMQVENEWFCHNPVQEEKYLRELGRYLRENGCQVPLFNCNNLYQPVQATFNAWNARDHLAADLRQLGIVQPDAPRLVSECYTGYSAVVGKPWPEDECPAQILHRLTQVLASGGQYNLYMFHGGTNFGFYSGRSVESAAEYRPTSYDRQAPLSEDGRRTAKYDAVKRISTFASQFGQVLAHVDAGRSHACRALAADDAQPVVIHQQGTQGDVIYILRGPGAKLDAGETLDLLLPTGMEISVPLGRDAAAWILLRANLGGMATLDYTNLRPWAFHGRKMLVLYGPAGAEGMVSLNGAMRRFTVPVDRELVVCEQEDLTLVVLNEDQVDVAYLCPTGLYVGASGLDEDNQPLPHADWKAIAWIQFDGTIQMLSAKMPKPLTAPKLGSWEEAGVGDYLDGSAAEYQPLAGPMSLEALKCDYGYGWYRLTMPAAVAASAAMAPGAGDRLHIYQEGKLSALLGQLPGAEAQPAKLRLGEKVVVLADNMGRFHHGWQMGEHKGLFDHVYAVKPVTLGKAKASREPSPDAFALSGFWPGLRVGGHHTTDALTWTFKGQTELPMVLEVGDVPARFMIYLNGKPAGMYDPHMSAHHLRLTLSQKNGLLKANGNELKLAFFAEEVEAKAIAAVSKGISLYQATQNMTGKAEWAFAPWSRPKPEAFAPLGRGGKTEQPRWYRATFTVTGTHQPLWLDARGLTKGQLYLNGRNLGRYFVADMKGKAVPPQTHYYLPEGWLKTDGPNELMIFDEHGAGPAQCKLIYAGGKDS